jgi:hypothetical protein
MDRYQAREIVLHDEDISGGAKLLYFALDDYARDSGHCWPSQRTISKFGFPNRSLRRFMRELEGAGFVESRRRRLKNGPMEYKLQHRPNWPELAVSCGQPGRSKVSILAGAIPYMKLGSETEIQGASAEDKNQKSKTACSLCMDCGFQERVSRGLSYAVPCECRRKTA